MTTTFDVPDMSCGHCQAAITRALTALDPRARVEVDLAAHRVRVESERGADELAAAIRDEGYTPTVAAAG